MLKKIFKLFKITIALALLLAISAMAVKYYLSNDLIKNTLAKTIYEATGRQTSIDRISGDFIKSISLYDIHVNPAQTSSCELNIKDCNLKYSLPSVFKGVFRINEITVNNCELKCKRTKDGNFDIGDVISRFSSFIEKPHLAQNLPVNIDYDIRKINFNELKIKLTDEYQNDSAAVYTFKLKNFTLNPKAGFKVVELASIIEIIKNDITIVSSTAISGLFNVPLWSADCTIQTEKIDLSKINPFIEYLTDSLKFDSGFLKSFVMVKYIGGRVEMSGKTACENIILNIKGLPFPIVSKNLNLNFDENTVRFYDSTVGIKGFETKFEGAVSNFFDKTNIAFMLKTTMSQTYFEKLFSAVKTVLPYSILQNYYSSGNFDLNLMISGMGLNYLSWDINALLTFNKINIISALIPIDIRNLNGQIELLKGNITVKEPITFSMANRNYEFKGFLRDIRAPYYDFILKSASSTQAISEDAEDDTESIDGKTETNSNSRPNSCKISVNARFSGTHKRQYFAINSNISNLEIYGIAGLPKIQLNASMAFNNNHFIAKNILLKIDDMALTGLIDVIGFNKNGRLRILADVKNANLVNFRNQLQAYNLNDAAGTASVNINVYGKYDALSGLVKISGENINYDYNPAGGKNLKIPAHMLNLIAKINKNMVNSKYEITTANGKNAGETNFNLNSSEVSLTNLFETDKLKINEFIAQNSEFIKSIVDNIDNSLKQPEIKQQPGTVTPGKQTKTSDEKKNEPLKNTALNINNGLTTTLRQ